MINWLNIVYHLPWVIGAATILAVISYADWQATQQGLKLRYLLSRTVFQKLINLGFGLISLGLFLLAGIWWEQVVWGFFALFFLWQIWLLYK